MFSKGYRPSGSNQHISVVRFAGIFFEEENVILFDKIRRKRHSTIYDTTGIISRKEAINAVDKAERLIQEIETMIKDN